MTGRTLTHYAILGKLGEGGMGVVYQARDLTLNRLVALKVLPPDRLASPERKRRFLQEAQAASALNHPHIVTIHEFASDQGCDFLVMEYIEGKTLDRLIPKHGLPLNEALDYAVQVADALTRAHAAGIVHRDLKPGNVIVDKNGQVKVLDFGLARLVAQASACEDQASACETVTAVAKTDEGTIVGTASYMSPEQAEGRPVDARSDIFSFGAVLYEMLTGRRAFQGDSGMSTLAAIIKQEPEPLPAETPHDLGKIVARCLRKDPAWRFQHMDDLRVALAELKLESDSGKLTPAQPAAKRRRSRRWAAVAAVCVIAAGLAGAWLTRRAAKPAGAPELRIVPLTTYPGIERHPTFSPDGSQVAFGWDGEKGDNLDIYVKLVSGGPPLRLTTSPERDAMPAWSPDGRWIAFVRSGPQPALHLVSPLGGLERKLTRASAQGLAWTPDSRHIVCVDRGSDREPFSLWLVSAETGERTRLTAPAAQAQGDTMPAISPDGRSVAFNRTVVPIGIGEVWLAPLAGGEPHRLFQDALNPVNLTWTPDGREIVYSAELTGSPAGSPSSRLRRITVAEENARPRPVAGTGEGATQPAISRPDRNGLMRLAFTRIQSDFNLWRLDLPPAGKAPARPSPLSHSTARDYVPSVSPDGSRVVFVSSRSGNDELWLAQGDGSNPIQLTSFGESMVVGSPRWSPDGKTIVCDVLAGGNRDLYLVNPDGGAPRRLTTEPSAEARPSFSRDGRWVYFGSNRTGNFDIWKLPAGGGPMVQVTRKGGSEPLESWDGKLVHYMKSTSQGGLWSVPAAGGEEEEVFAGVGRGHWCVTAAGIYFVDGSAPGAGVSIRSLDPASGKITTIHTIEKPVPPAGFRVLSASADGRRVVFAQIDHSSSDLMLVENFR